MAGYKDSLTTEISALTDLILFLQNCKQKKLKTSEVGILLKYFYSGENQFRDNYPEIYQKLDHEVIALLKKEYQSDQSNVSELAMTSFSILSHLSNQDRNNTFLPKSLKKALKIAEKKLRKTENHLTLVKEIEEDFEKKLTGAKEAKKRRKADQVAKLTLNQDAIEQQGKVSIRKIERLITEVEELVNAHYEAAQSLLESILPKDNFTNPFGHFRETGVKAQNFINRMKELLAQLLRNNWDVKRGLSMNLAILNGIEAVSLGDSKDFVTSINGLCDEIFDAEPDMLLALNWWLKSLKTFERELARVLKKWEQKQILL